MAWAAERSQPSAIRRIPDAAPASASACSAVTRDLSRIPGERSE
jgi:hypothetical protein